MAIQGNETTRAFAKDELGSYLSVMSRIDAGSGVDGAGHSHAYSGSDPLDLEVGREREIIRWSVEIGETGWRRAWGLFNQHDVVGYLYLAGGELASELHRVNLGMGVLGSYRRRGGATSLLDAAVRWARQQPNIEWIDLGVFSDNPGAQALYERHGFEVLGRTPDRFRVEGQSLDEILMTLNVARHNA